MCSVQNKDILKIVENYKELLKKPYGMFNSYNKQTPDLFQTLRLLWKKGNRTKLYRVLGYIRKARYVHKENKIDAAILYGAFAVKDESRRRKGSKLRLRKAIEELRQVMKYADKPTAKIRILDKQASVMMNIDPDKSNEIACCVLRIVRDRIKYARQRNNQALIKKYVLLCPDWSLLILCRIRHKNYRYHRLFKSIKKYIPKDIMESSLRFA